MHSKGSEQTFQRRHTDGQQTHEQMLNITNHQETQIKATIRFHLTLIKMTITKKTKGNECWQGLWKTGNLCALLVGM